MENPYREPGKGIILSRDWDSGMDVCVHEWECVDKRHEFTIYRCSRNGCLRFDSPYRSSLDEFLKVFLRVILRLPKMESIPEGGLVSLEWIKKKTGLEDYDQTKKYIEVIEGLGIINDDSIRMIGVRTNGTKPVVYRDPLSDKSKKRRSSKKESSEETLQAVAGSFLLGIGATLVIEGLSRFFTGKGLLDHASDFFARTKQTRMNRTKNLQQTVREIEVPPLANRESN